MKKRLISLVLALALCMGLAVPAGAQAVSAEDTAPTGAAYSTSAAPKGILLYVGYKWNAGTTKYPVYSADDINTLSTATSEFILCSGNTEYNYYQFNNSTEKQIITEELINNMSASLIAFPATLEQVKADYLSILNGTSAAILRNGGETHVNDLLGRLDPSWQASRKTQSVSPYLQSLLGHLDPGRYPLNANSSDSISWVDSKERRFFKLDDLADDVVNQVNIIVSANPNATIWLPFPTIEFPSLSAQYVQPFTQYVNNLKSRLGTTWTTNIRGFYWGTEAVVQYYTPFVYSGTAAQGFGNPMVQLMISVDSLITSNSKQFLWIPYLGETETMTRNGYVANRSSIFDYAIFQASYYFYATAENYNNLALIQKSVLNNRLYSRNNVVIGNSKSGSTSIGYEMELNDTVIYQAENDRYWYYTYFYSDLKSYPCVFYAGDRDSVCADTVGAKQCFKYVKLWFT